MTSGFKFCVISHFICPVQLSDTEGLSIIFWKFGNFTMLILQKFWQNFFCKNKTFDSINCVQHFLKFQKLILRLCQFFSNHHNKCTRQFNSSLVSGYIKCICLILKSQNITKQLILVGANHFGFFKSFSPSKKLNMFYTLEWLIFTIKHVYIDYLLKENPLFYPNLQKCTAVDFLSSSTLICEQLFRMQLPVYLKFILLDI